MKRLAFAAALFAVVAHAAPDADPFENVTTQKKFMRPTKFEQEMQAAFVDAGVLSAAVVNLSGTMPVVKTTLLDAGSGIINGNLVISGVVPTLKTDVLDAGVALINGQLQVLGPTVAAGVTGTTANFTTSANTVYAQAAGVDAGSVRIANTYAPIAASQDGGTGAMTRIQFGMCVLSANSCAVTFNVAFSTIPQCLCSSVNGTAAACGVSATASTSAVTFKGANATDQIQWVCFGDK